MLHKFVSRLVIACIPAVSAGAAQPGGHSLRQRDVPCQAQYTQAVETIGLARWSAPEVERPSIERLLNAAAKAKELVDASFVQYEPSLCSPETLRRLHASLDKLERNGWLPATPEERRGAEVAAVNAELLKAMDAGLDESTTENDGSSSTRPSNASMPRRLSQ